MLKLILKTWLPLAATVTLICFIVYGTVQTSYRSNANDPQIQIAEDMVYSLEHGVQPDSLVGAQRTEISKNLLPFSTIYDEKGNPLASDAMLDGKIPSMPSGVLDFTRRNQQDWITWQPRPGVRIALVIMHTKNPFNGFVAAGRSLRLVEEREAMLGEQVLFGWVVSLISLLLFVALLQFLIK